MNLPLHLVPLPPPLTFSLLLSKSPTAFTYLSSDPKTSSTLALVLVWDDGEEENTTTNGRSAGTTFAKAVAIADKNPRGLTESSVRCTCLANSVASDDFISCKTSPATCFASSNSRSSTLFSDLFRSSTTCPIRSGTSGAPQLSVVAAAVSWECVDVMYVMRRGPARKYKRAEVVFDLERASVWGMMNS